MNFKETKAFQVSFTPDKAYLDFAISQKEELKAHSVPLPGQSGHVMVRADSDEVGQMKDRCSRGEGMYVSEVKDDGVSYIVFKFDLPKPE